MSTVALTELLGTPVFDSAGSQCGRVREVALTPQEDPALRAAGPERRVLGTFGQHGFDEVDGEHAGHLPRRQDERGKGGGVFDRAQQTLRSGIIGAYAVVKA